MKTNFEAATGSWRKSAVEFTEQAYGFLLQRENSLLEHCELVLSGALKCSRNDQCAVLPMLKKCDRKKLMGWLDAH